MKFTDVVLWKGRLKILTKGHLGFVASEMVAQTIPKEGSPKNVVLNIGSCVQMDVQWHQQAIWAFFGLFPPIWPGRVNKRGLANLHFGLPSVALLETKARFVAGVAQLLLYCFAQFLLLHLVGN